MSQTELSRVAAKGRPAAPQTGTPAGFADRTRLANAHDVAIKRTRLLP